MVQGTLFGPEKTNTLMGEYAELLSDAILRDRARTAEHKARIETELANKVKSEFISNMSHELRTPLNTVIGFSRILSEHDKHALSDEKVVEYSNLILAASAHLLSVINDILDISKIQSGKYTLDAREISIDEILDACVKNIATAADEAGVAVKIKKSAYLHSIRGDAAKLEQALNNIISNAVKFSPEGGEVEVEARQLSDGGVMILVRDSGIGMTDEEVEVAMTPFGQVDGTRSRNREGTGLGLPIAKALIELHAGTLSIACRKGKGTQIEIRLPSRHTVSVSESRNTLFGRGILD